MENRKERLEKNIESSATTQNSKIIRAISGSEILKNILGGYNKNEEAKNEQSVKDDGYIRELLERFNDIVFSEKLSGQEVDSEEPMILHEIIHNIDFGNEEQSINQQENFSDDESLYSEQIKALLEYITLIKEFGDSTYIRIKREGNIISYSRINKGFSLDKHEINMISPDNLIKIYEMLKVSFGSDFVFGSKHDMFEGWSLLPIIGDKIILDISSDDFADNNWIYDEIHNRPPMIIDEPKKF